MYFGMCVHIQHGGQASTLTELLSFVFEVARVNYPNTHVCFIFLTPLHTPREGQTHCTLHQPWFWGAQ